MTTYNTGNPLGSTSPKDLYDNAENLDELVNSTTKETHPDRFGVDRKTWHGMETEFDADQADRAAEFAAFLADSGYVGTGTGGAFEDYDADGPLTITAYNEIFTKDGEFYRAKAGTTLPYTTTGTWATDEVDFVSVGDAALRQELSADAGGELVGTGAITKVGHITELLALTGQVDGQKVETKSYHSGYSIGGGTYIWSSSADKDDHNGVTVHSPTVPWDGDAANLPDYLAGTGEADPSGTGCWLLEDTGEIRLTQAGAIGDYLSDKNDNIASLRAAEKASFRCYIEPGQYYCSESFTPTTKIEWYGSDTLEGGNSHTKFVFPVGINGFELTDNAAASSSISGFTLKADQARAVGGRIIEYAPSAGVLLFGAGVSSRVAGDVFEVRAARTLDTVRAEFTLGVDEESRTGITYAIPLHDVSGTFQVDEIVTGGTSGETGRVFFISEEYNALVVDQCTGVFDDDETITGGTSGATAIAGPHGGSLTPELSRASITLDSGTIGEVVDSSGFSQEVFVKKGTFGHGILATRRFYGDHLAFEAWGGDGCLIATTDGYTGNANLCRLYGFRSTNCGGNGLRLIGGDSNAGSFKAGTFVACFGFPIVDRSFLGNTFDSCHTNGCLLGGYNCQGTAGARSSVWINMYAELGRGITAPWPIQRSTICGGSVWIGGVTGLPVVRERDDSTGDGGTYILDGDIAHEFDSIRNGIRSILPKNSGNPTVGFYARGDVAGERAVVLEYGGTLAGSDGELYKLGMSPYARKAFGDTAGSGRYTYEATRLRGRVSYSLASISGTGSGASASVVTDGSGVVTEINVMTEGAGYDETTTVTVPGGTGGVFTPVVQGGRITRIIVENGGSGYTGADYVEIYRAETLSNDPALVSGADNARKLGKAAARWSTVYAGTGTINTSDANEKQQVRPLDDAERAVAQACKGLIRAYKFNDAVERKGDDARIHIGVIAQDVEQAFIDEGLDPSIYAMFCRDSWWEVDGQPASDEDEGAVKRERLGIRYDELLAFIIGAI
ncbi:MAG TPA: hypothetical protein DCZ13_02585 [Porticoccaceae bacterium]|nr:hypothetical protein [Porticoccaceae bacterium]